MGNVYSKIEKLIEKKKEINRLMNLFVGDKTKLDEYVRLCEEDTAIESQLRKISRKHHISPVKMASILSEEEGRLYRFKIFIETSVKDDKRHATGDFIACYLNDKNKFFDYNKNALSHTLVHGDERETFLNYELTIEEFADLKASLNSENSYILSQLNEVTFIPDKWPSAYLLRANFTKMLAEDRVNKAMSSDFFKKTKDKVKKVLEQIELEDENNIKEENNADDEVGL